LIVVYHNFYNVTRVVSDFKEAIEFNKRNSIAREFAHLANLFPEEHLLWCLEDVAAVVNWEIMPEVLHHNKLMLSYNPSSTHYFGAEIGYVEESPFINVNKKVTYPTWQMSSAIGAIHASALLFFKDKINVDTDFDYFLNSVAKLGMPRGLFCYSEPKLLKAVSSIYLPQANAFVFFKFVKQHYKFRWLFLLALNLIIFEKRLPILPFLRALFFKNRNKIDINLDSITVKSSRKVMDQATIDVIIPTIGRKRYLYDVLKDFSQQTHLPQKIIIVEQNPVEGSNSELNYLTNEKWPFEIQHIFTHQAGACNARNLALNQVENEWVFLADDDNRFESTLLSDVFSKIEQFGIEAVTTSYLQKNEEQLYKIIHQSGIFGSGNSFVKTTTLEGLRFDMALEFGYGEDTDFGMQLRNTGFDVIYFPEIRITHLKAPMGGFRIRVPKQWEYDKVQPKPSPFIMYVLLKNYTKEQLSCYKLVLFLKLIKKESFLSSFDFIKLFQKKWYVSLFWANKLNNND
jgi:GT2 family glycosyltransferase